MLRSMPGFEPKCALCICHQVLTKTCIAACLLALPLVNRQDSARVCTAVIHEVVDERTTNVFLAANQAAHTTLSL